MSLVGWWPAGTRVEESWGWIIFLLNCSKAALRKGGLSAPHSVCSDQRWEAFFLRALFQVVVPPKELILAGKDAAAEYDELAEPQDFQDDPEWVLSVLWRSFPLNTWHFNRVICSPLCLQHILGLFSGFLGCSGGGVFGGSEISNANLSACGLDCSVEVCSLWGKMHILIAVDL